MKRRREPEKTVLLIDQQRSKALMDVVKRRARKSACLEEKKDRNASSGLAMAILAASTRLSSHHAQNLEGGADQDMRPDNLYSFRVRAS